MAGEESSSSLQGMAVGGMDFGLVVTGHIARSALCHLQFTLQPDILWFLNACFHAHP